MGKSWLQVFSPFPSMFLKGYIGVIKTLDCVAEVNKCVYFYWNVKSLYEDKQLN